MPIARKRKKNPIAPRKPKFLGIAEGEIAIRSHLPFCKRKNQTLRQRKRTWRISLGMGTNAITYYPGTEIQRRRYGKGELARLLNIAPKTMRKEIKFIAENKLRPTGYNKYQKTLTVRQVEIYLLHIGVIGE